jgi:hypothetical protein
MNPEEFSMSETHDPQRRRFLKAASAAAAAATAFPPTFHVHASDKSGSKPAIVGSGEFTYECHHNWGEAPPRIRWHATHGVAIDEAGLVYITHRAPFRSDIDTTAVFEPSGRFVRSFGKQWNFGGHGIDIRKDGNDEYLYLSITTTKPPDGSAPRPGLVVKTTLKGEIVWELPYPKESGLYAVPEKYSPTNLAFAPDGGFYVADGYGSDYIHQYDANTKLIRSFGGTGERPGQFKTPHGLWLDNRPGRDPRLIVADRANGRLQYFTLDGKPDGIVGNVSFPAHFDIQGSKLLIPDLHARISIFDRDNQVSTHLGYDPKWTEEVLAGFKMREQPERWLNGRFVHPHDACFDRDGNIYVVEWVTTGRISCLRKVA